MHSVDRLPEKQGTKGGISKAILQNWALNFSNLVRRKEGIRQEHFWGELERKGDTEVMDSVTSMVTNVIINSFILTR